MVISDKYRYVFVELFHTGSTAVSSELCELYDGKKILKKHSRYHEFLETATEEQKKYFTFSGIRNPMDVVVSEYLKIKNNHKGRYTNPSEWRRNGGTLPDKMLKLRNEITSKDLSFQEYFMKYFKMPYDNWSRLNHQEFNFIIRFENIRSDFAEALRGLNIEPKRELPQINKTSEKKDFTEYFTPEIQKRAVFVFGPFMKKWGYSFPQHWTVKKAGILSLILFKSVGKIRQLYWSSTKSKSSPAQKNKN